MTTTAEVEEAKIELGRAVQKYFDVIASGEYVKSWVIISHRMSVTMEQDGQKTVIGLSTATDQSWVETRGMMSIALDSERKITRNG